MLKAVNSSSLAILADSPNRNDDDGDKRLQRIARAGRQWKHTIGRKVDMEGAFSCLHIYCYFPQMIAAYVYRLCLEYARLWADDRDAMSYTA